MADYYCEFSLALPLTDDAQRAWGAEVEAFLGDQGRWADAPPHLAALLDDDMIENEWVGYAVSVDDDGLWIHSDESGEPDQVARLVQAYLRRFDPDGSFGFEWAHTCSKPRLDAFGGGAAFITADEVRIFGTGEWLSHAEADRKARLDQPPTTHDHEGTDPTTTTTEEQA